MGADYRQSLARLGRAMLRQARQLQLEQTAGSLSFLTLLAIVPLFSIVFAVTAALPAFGHLREALQRFMLANLFPSSISNTVIGHLNQFAAKSGELSLIGTAALVVTAYLALVTIEQTLNRIWAADRPRPFVNRFLLYWMLLTLGPLLLGAYLTAYARVATAWLRGTSLSELRSVWFLLLPWITTVGGLMLLYRLLPSAVVRWREALAGAVLAALLLELLRRLLGWYVARLATYTVVYGAFSALPVFLLWLFLAWTAVLAGALLAANLRFWGQSAEPHLARTPAERFEDAHGVLRAMRAALGDDRYGTLPVRELAPLLDDDPERAGAVAMLLARLGYLTRFVALGRLDDGRAAPATRRTRLAVMLARRWPSARPGAESVWS
ncbi:MAG: YihY family inner membrane protein, partial [Burkholderiaceae bacterium]|nr:YihY family inner membrane protein [Burkholderiaceae bacterium]